MRTHIVNATVVDGTGAPPRTECSLLIEDHVITDVLDVPVAAYDVSDVVVDAKGGFVLPGLVNHHAHGLTRGPLMIVGQPALSDARVSHNVRRNLRGGVTTAMNVDGFPTVEDAVAITKRHPLNLRVSSLHTPAHLDWVDDPFPFGGVLPRHRLGLDRMVADGALAVGETGPGIDGHWADYTLIPVALEGVGASPVDRSTAERLREATERADHATVDAVLADVLPHRNDSRVVWEGLFERVQAWREKAAVACEEAIDAARARDLPVVFHHTPATFDRLVAAAEDSGNRIIAAHSNYLAESPDDAVRRATELRRRGALIDVMSGDTYGPARFFQNNDVQFALFERGLVDMISSDYVGGFWDSLLTVVDRASRAGVMTIGEGVRMVTSTPAAAVPGLAPLRGTLEPGLVADVVVTAPGVLDDVRVVLASGRRVDLAAHDPLAASTSSAGCC